MGNEGANQAAGAAPTHVWRLGVTVIGTDPKTLAAISNAVTGKLDGSILDSQVHVVKDDAHPAARAK